jgi:hypothetical protein
MLRLTKNGWCFLRGGSWSGSNTDYGRAHYRYLKGPNFEDFIRFKSRYQGFRCTRPITTVSTSLIRIK